MNKQQCFGFVMSRTMSSLTFNLDGPYNWIDNKRVEPVDAGKVGKIENLEPRSGKLLASVPNSGKDEVDRAVQSAKKAFASWSKLTGMERGRILTRAAQLIKDHQEELAKFEVIDNGKPIWEARMDIDTVTASLEFYGGIAASIVGQHVKLADGSFAIISKDPLGVVGGIGKS